MAIIEVCSEILSYIMWESWDNLYLNMGSGKNSDVYVWFVMIAQEHEHKQVLTEPTPTKDTKK